MSLDKMLTYLVSSKLTATTGCVSHTATTAWAHLFSTHVNTSHLPLSVILGNYSETENISANRMLVKTRGSLVH